MYSHSKYLHRVLFFTLVFEAVGGEGLVVVIGVGQQGVVKSCCVLLYSGEISSPGLHCLSNSRSKLKSEGRRASLRSSKTTCVRRSTCWVRVAATCCRTRSVTIRSVSVGLNLSNRKCACVCMPVRLNKRLFPINIPDYSTALLGEDGSHHVSNPDGVPWTRPVSVHHTKSNGNRTLRITRCLLFDLTLCFDLSRTCEIRWKK